MSDCTTARNVRRQFPIEIGKIRFTRSRLNRLHRAPLKHFAQVPRQSFIRDPSRHRPPLFPPRTLGMSHALATATTLLARELMNEPSVPAPQAGLLRLRSSSFTLCSCFLHFRFAHVARASTCSGQVSSRLTFPQVCLLRRSSPN